MYPSPHSCSLFFFILGLPIFFDHSIQLIMNEWELPNTYFALTCPPMYGGLFLRKSIFSPSDLLSVWVLAFLSHLLMSFPRKDHFLCLCMECSGYFVWLGSYSSGNSGGKWWNFSFKMSILFLCFCTLTISTSLFPFAIWESSKTLSLLGYWLIMSVGSI